MPPLWQSISRHIVAPSQLNASQLFSLLTPAGRSLHLRRHAASVILARVQLIAALFAVLVPLCSIVDLLVFPSELAWQLVILRIASALLFVALAWPRELSAAHPYRQALLHLLGLLMIPPLFHLFAADALLGAGTTQAQRLVAQLYTYLPTIVLGGLAIFPLTALETLGLALPVIVTGLLGATSGQTLSLEQHGGTLWFMSMMLGVAVFSGMSQCHYMATLVLKAMHDPLTGAFTRQSGEEALNLLFRLNAMADKPLTLAFFDLDHFKSINDTWGHEAGDRCLQTLADRIRQGLRRSDLLVRWGGEEFIALLPDTPSDNVEILLRRLRASGLGTRPDGTALTASVGIAASSEDGITAWEQLVQRADQRMYAAKALGRDGVVTPAGDYHSLTPEP
ncbi:GGDEF domain-containing protein [Dechloromonas sp. ZY10]|uniref:GGDEF domain-containing protein n=1 Tax=Dechloromonas aquae TaxID=2664436 RepID=UPI003527B6F7